MCYLLKDYLNSNFSSCNNKIDLVSRMYDNKTVHSFSRYIVLVECVLIKFLHYRCEMIKNALEVLNICSVLPKVQLILCEPTPKIQDTSSDLLEEEIYDEDENDNVGLNIIIKAAEGDLLDADIQKAALSVIITCVCAPIHRVCNLFF